MTPPTCWVNPSIAQNAVLPRTVQLENIIGPSTAKLHLKEDRYEQQKNQLTFELVFLFVARGGDFLSSSNYRFQWVELCSGTCSPLFCTA